MPHAAREDDEYSGFFIPKGTMVAGNAWFVSVTQEKVLVLIFPIHRAILHDPAHFENPMVFEPDRYLKDGKLDPSAMDPDAAFGFGRR